MKLKLFWSSLLAGMGKYLLIVIGALVVAVGIQKYRYDALKANFQATALKLEVSNASLASATDALHAVNSQLDSLQQKERAREAVLQRTLARQEAAHEKAKRMERQLLSRQVTSNCPVPQELIDAWNNL